MADVAEIENQNDEETQNETFLDTGRRVNTFEKLKVTTSKFKKDGSRMDMIHFGQAKKFERKEVKKNLKEVVKRMKAKLARKQAMSKSRKSKIVDETPTLKRGRLT